MPSLMHRRRGGTLPAEKGSACTWTEPDINSLVANLPRDYRAYLVREDRKGGPIDPPRKGSMGAAGLRSVDHDRASPDPALSGESTPLETACKEIGFPAKTGGTRTAQEIKPILTSAKNSWPRTRRELTRFAPIWVAADVRAFGDRLRDVVAVCFIMRRLTFTLLVVVIFGS